MLLNKKEFLSFSCRPSFLFRSLASWTCSVILMQRFRRTHGCTVRLGWRCVYGPLWLGSIWWSLGWFRSLILAVQMDYMDIGWGLNIWNCRLQWCWSWLLFIYKRELWWCPRCKGCRRCCLSLTSCSMDYLWYPIRHPSAVLQQDVQGQWENVDVETFCM